MLAAHYTQKATTHHTYLVISLQITYFK